MDDQENIDDPAIVEVDPEMDELRKVLRNTMSEKLITNFVIIAEVTDEDGQSLSLSVSDSITPWLAYGMINSALAMLGSGEYQFPSTEE
jgi:hypothetical protein